jgi:hypothetical protein
VSAPEKPKEKSEVSETWEGGNPSPPVYSHIKFMWQRRAPKEISPWIIDKRELLEQTTAAQQLFCLPPHIGQSQA